MNEENTSQDSEMRDHYDFSNGVRGKYAGKFPKWVTMLPLEKDVAEVFTDSKQINEILRALIPFMKKPEVAGSDEERLAS